MQGNVLAKTVAGGEKLNVFVQENEPSKKDGVWFRGSSDWDSIKFTTGTKTLSSTQLTDTDQGISTGRVVTIGTDIYLIGGQSSKYNCKYDTLTDTYTRLANIPNVQFTNGSAVAIGTDIYILRGDYNYKYDTLTDTYTRLANIPYEHINGNAVAIGTDIYIYSFSGSGSSQYPYVYKYNTLTNSYTKLASLPITFKNPGIAVVNDNVYLFGSSYSSTYYKIVYKHNIKTDVYTQVMDAPYNVYNTKAFAVGNNIYLLHGNTDFYLYNVLSNMYITLKKDYPFIGDYFGVVGHTIYSFGSDANSSLANAAYKFEIPPAHTKLTKNLALDTISNIACLYNNNEVVNLPLYYGDGTEWVQV